MGPLLERWKGCCVGSRRVGPFGTTVCAVLLGCGALGVAWGGSPAGAQEYSAYEDGRKPVISFLFSQDDNVEDFRREFGLDDGEVRRALAATREETATLEEEHAESERVVEANGELRPSEIGEKIAATDFDEEVEAAVAGTKEELESLLPEGRRADFGEWVDRRWEQEQEEYYAARTVEARGSSRGIRCKTIYASWYRSTTKRGNNHEVALPHQNLKFDGGYKVRVHHDGRSARAPVKEVGPWNTKDNYWAARKHRSMWRDLPRCRPQAEAAFFGNYNRGRDQFGREVLNPAGIDLTLSVASAMGVGKKLKRNGLIKVSVGFPWVRG